MTVTQRQPNGLNRPRYFDRQLLNADDLALEQGFADQRLALLARHCFGWGVAAGLGLTLAAQNSGRSDLTVSPGYGLTPLGDEIYLTREVVLQDIAALIAGACGQGHDCTNLDAPTTAVGRVTSAWIIARPADVDGVPRPAMPQGCGNPGNNLKPSRSCGGASVEIACALMAPHLQVEDPVALVCGPWGPPMPDPVAEAANYVVLGAIEIMPEGVFATPLFRRIIGRLDRVGRVACTCQERVTRYVTHILPDEADVDRRIDKLAGFDATGRFFIETLDASIAAIEGGAHYATLSPSRASRVIAVHRRRKRKYLRTDDDATTTDNLLSLPRLHDDGVRPG